MTTYTAYTWDRNPRQMPIPRPVEFRSQEALHLRSPGGFNPFEKYARQIGSFHRGFGVKIKHV